jgi:hypothetical protein
MIKKHSINEPIKARIVRIELPFNEEQTPCVKVELHGILIEESTGVNWLLFYCSYIIMRSSCLSPLPAW